MIKNCLFLLCGIACLPVMLIALLPMIPWVLFAVLKNCDI
jgi:hypothetical protein